jgi:hypothetical protein
MIRFFVTDCFYFSFLHYPNSIALKQSTRTPTAPPAGCASYLVSPPLSPRVFGWLLCFFFRRLAAAGIFVVIVKDVAVLAVLAVVIFIALIVAITLPLCPFTVVWPIPFPLRHAGVFLVGCRVKKIDRFVGDVAVLAVLVVVIFVALVIAIALPNCSCTVVQPIPSPLRHARVFLVGC